MCSMVLQKQQIKNVKHPPFILVQNEATICIAIFLPLNYPSDPRSWLLKKQAKLKIGRNMELKSAEKWRS